MFRERLAGKSEGLDVVFRALGGERRVAEMFGRSRSTVSRWRRGVWPMPAEVIHRMRYLAHGARCRIDDALFWDLNNNEIAKAEVRANLGNAKRREAFQRNVIARGPWLPRSRPGGTSPHRSP